MFRDGVERVADMLTRVPRLTGEQVERLVDVATAVRNRGSEQVSAV